MTKLKSIQCLRGIAALLVFFCHLIAIDQQAAQRPSLLTSLAENGAHGVDLFFVISGFVIVWVASATAPGGCSAARFLYARATRIYPLWWLCAASMAVAYLVLTGSPWNTERLATYNISGVAHLVRSFFLWPQAHHPVLGVGWTLVHEIYFYLVFAVLIFCLSSKARPYGLLIWTCAIFAGASIGLSAEFAGTLIHLAFYPMTLQFILGAFIAYLIKAGHSHFAKSCLTIGTAGFIASYAELDRALIPFLSDDAAWSLVWRRTIMFGIPSAFVIYGAVALECRHDAKNIAISVLAKLGDWSYALYLCHSLVLALIGMIIYRGLNFDGVWAISAYFLFGTLVTFLTTALLHRLVERPSIAFFKSIRSTTADRAKSAAA